MKPSEALDKAAEIVERNGWIQGEWYARSDDRLPEDSPISAGGAINLAFGYLADCDHDDTCGSPIHAVFELMAKWVDPEHNAALIDPIDSFSSWEDAKGRTAEQVIAELRAAAASEREAGR